MTPFSIQTILLQRGSGARPSEKTACPVAPYPTLAQVALVANTSTSRSSLGLCNGWPTDIPRTESKATTSWTVAELSSMLPKLLHSRIRESRYYSRGSDSLSFQAQTQRSRDANARENRKKLYEEIMKLYSETVPGASVILQMDSSVWASTDTKPQSPEKIQKHINM